MRALRTLLALAYPLVVYGGLRVLTPREMALALAGLFALRAVTRWGQPDAEQLRQLLAPASIVGAVLVATVASDDARFLLLAPALANLALLLAFGRTLVGPGPPLVETFARLQDPDLSPEEVAYCRRVTLVWCLFFAANAGVCAWLALRASPGLWALYTGLVAYLLVGLLFLIEFVVRAWRFGRYEGTLAEPLFRRLFPRSDAS